jgi:hypothetical protein
MFMPSIYGSTHMVPWATLGIPFLCATPLAIFSPKNAFSYPRYSKVQTLGHRIMDINRMFGK